MKVAQTTVREDEMQERINLLAEALMYAFMLLAGGIGGAAMAGRRVLTHSPTTFAMVVAYTIVGAASGGVVWAVMTVFGMQDQYDYITVLGFCTASGAAIAAVLGTVQGGLSVVLEKLGWHLEIKVDRRKAGHRMAKRRQDAAWPYTPDRGDPRHREDYPREEEL